MQHELRSLTDSVEYREIGGRSQIVGYAAVFNSFSEDLGGFREIIRPGAFRRALSSGQDVRALFNHDTSAILGRTKAGTLRLSEDARGLRYEVDVPDTQAARDVTTSLKRGDITGSSFAFMVPNAAGETWRQEPDKVVRELLDVDLFDVGPVVYPAYPATVSVAAQRSLDQLKQQTSHVHSTQALWAQIARRR